MMGAPQEGAAHCGACGFRAPIAFGGKACPVCDSDTVLDRVYNDEPQEDWDWAIALAEFERQHGPADVDEYEAWLAAEGVTA